VESGTSDLDAIVIGAGEAGSVVASLAVEAGKRVALIIGARSAAPVLMPVAFRANF